MPESRCTPEKTRSTIKREVSSPLPPDHLGRNPAAQFAQLAASPILPASRLAQFAQLAASPILPASRLAQFAQLAASPILPASRNSRVRAGQPEFAQQSWGRIVLL